ncbi:hypothetical protein F3J20_12160 [Paraburkholderia sp. Cy-641]|nr:hypothetical protein [Paraburkholderia sp. Cy-641]
MDTRLRQRFDIVLEQLWSGIGQTIPFTCLEWSSVKSAYLVHEMTLIHVSIWTMY